MKKSDNSTTSTSEKRPGLPVPLGRIVATPNSLATLTHEDFQSALQRHVCGDWGDCCREDAAENDFALDKYLRLFSVYHSAAGVKFWVITEADRSATTVLLPEDY